MLKDLIDQDTTDPEDADVHLASGSLGEFKNVCHRLLCINTAFELLSGQGQYTHTRPSAYPEQALTLIFSPYSTP